MKNYQVTVIDYGIGNVWSVMSALKYLGVEAELVSDPEVISRSLTLILPGVGSFRKGMEILKSTGIDKAILSAVMNNKAKILGICLGMQLLGAYGTEDGGTTGLGLVSNRVERFKAEELNGHKIPHVGFHSVQFSEKKGLFRDFGDSSDFYFTHSYRMHVGDIEERYATCTYGTEFLAAFQIGNICGAQFHPEKSQTNGLLLLRNFLQDL
jgi:glutamine amidotransferase